MRKPFMVEFTGTPEAGKTTAISNVAKKLGDMGYSVYVAKESAETLPETIPKGTWYANLWMHYRTQAGLVKAKFSQADIVLIDRGLYDSKFYGVKFVREGGCSIDDYAKFIDQFLDELFPDFVIALMVPSQVALERRGGEGRLVNAEYILKYNKMFCAYYDGINCPKEMLSTAGLTVEEMSSQILSLILKQLP